MKPNETPSQYNEFSSWRGTWTAIGVYDKGEAVAHNGSSYVCLQYDVVGVEPGTDPAKWAMLAQGGESLAHPDLATHDAMGLSTDSELATHAAAADPHTGYQKESEKGQASGYPELDANSDLLVPGKLLWSADTNLYRAAANLLKTDDVFQAAGFTFPTDVYLTSADGKPRIYFGANGPTIERSGENTNLYAWRDMDNIGAMTLLGTGRLQLPRDGAGIEFGGTLDTNLYRAAAGDLLTDHRLSAKGGGGGGRTYIDSWGMYYMNPASDPPGGASVIAMVGDAGGSGKPGIVLGPGGGVARDTNLYRAAANILKTDDSFISDATGENTGFALKAFTGQGVSISNWGARRAVLNDYGITFYGAANDAQPNSCLVSDQSPVSGPVLRFGAGGSSALDVNLYRVAAAALKTDGRFEVGTTALAAIPLSLIRDNTAYGAFISMAKGSAIWNIGMGNEATPFLYIGGGDGVSQYFWRANWQDTNYPTNTFKAANNAANMVPLGVKGATDQTADLQRWLSVADAVLSKVDKDGIFWGPSSETGVGRQLTFPIGTGGPIYFGTFQTPNSNRAGFSVPSNVFTCVDAATMRFGIGGGGIWFVNNAPTALLEVRGKADETQVEVRAHSTQNSDLQRWLTSAGAVLASVDGSGFIQTAAGLLIPATAYIDVTQRAAPANPAAGTRRIYTDSTTGKLSVRKSDGTSVSLEEQGGEPDWSIIDAKGDLIVGSGADAVDNLAVGTNGQVLVADSNETLGMKWAATPAGTPADTVVTEKTYGQTEAVGTGTEYAREDHTHGTPSLPSGLAPAGGTTAQVLKKNSATDYDYSWLTDATVVPADTVVDERPWGLSPIVGTGEDYAREDHSHGSPTNPINAHEGASDPHTGYQQESEKDAANGYPGLDASSLISGGQVPATHSGSAHHNQEHGSADHAGATLPGETNEALGAFYLDIDQIAAPSNPAAGTRRVYMDSTTGKLSVRTSGGTSVSLEEQGGTPDWSVVDAKGDLIVGSGADAVDNLGVGTNGQVLVADSNETLGVKWAAAPAGTPADTVVTEKTFGQSEAVGTGTEYAREDHTHGTPTNPVTGHESTYDHTDIHENTEVAHAWHTAHHAQAHAINGSDHTGTLDDAQIPSTIARDTEVSTAISDHAAAGDPHTGYVLESAQGTIAGKFELQGDELIVLTGDTNNVTVGASTAVIRFDITPAAHCNVTGLTGGADGRVLVVLNIDTAYSPILKHENVGSDAANRIITPLGLDYKLSVGGGAVLIYDATASRWRMDTNLAPSDIAALALGTAASGTSNQVSRRDHVHPKATEAELDLSDVTTFDVSTARHGFAPKAPNDTAKFLRGDATWAVPPGGGGTPADTVVTEKTFGQSEAVGTGTDYAREDHTHGTPTNPVTAHESAGDPHTGYRLESADHSHASTGLEGGTVSHDVLTGVSADDHHAKSHVHYNDESGTVAHSSLGGMTENDHHTRSHGLESTSDHSLSGAASGEFLRATGATTWALEAVPVSKGGTILNPSAAIDVVIWRAPYACTITAVRGYQVGGSSTVVTAKKNGTSVLSGNLTLTNASTWYADTNPSTTALAAGDTLAISIVTVGSATQVVIQVDLTRP